MNKHMARAQQSNKATQWMTEADHTSLAELCSFFMSFLTSFFSGLGGAAFAALFPGTSLALGALEDLEGLASPTGAALFFGGCFRTFPVGSTVSDSLMGQPFGKGSLDSADTI